MNANAYGVNWIKQEHLLSDGVNGVAEEFLMNNEDGDIDQIAAQNLIFMARDGHISEIIEASTDENGTVIVSASDAADLDYQVVLHQAAEFEQVNDMDDGNDVTNVSYVEHYADDDPQMVTEEVITDDWVPHQGGERVEVSEEQILASSSQVLPDIEVPLPTIQDEYTALRPYPCDFCSRRFKKKISLINHLISHQNSGRTHLCKLCYSRFSKKSELIQHLQEHAENDPIETDMVGEVHKAERASSPRNDQYFEQEWQTDDVNDFAAAGREEMFDTECAFEVIHNGPIAPRGRVSRLKLKEYPIHEDNDLIENNLSQYDSYNYEDVDQNDKKVDVDNFERPQLLKHFPILNDSKPFVCQQCGLAFAREKALSSHSKTHHTVESQFECNECSEIFLDEESLQEHQKLHRFEESNSEFEPEEADESVNSDSEPVQHFSEYYCTECGISFHRLDLLKRHERMHLKQKATASTVKNSNQKPAQHFCTTCGEGFDEALNLLAHAEIHARHPPLKCQLCGEGFYDETAIKRHLQTNHPKELAATSCILCGKHCKDRKALMKHAWEHSREKCHSCSKCGKSFHNKARLKRHMSSHRDKSVTCDVCHAEFPDGRSLSNHRHSHSANSNGKLFPCNECGKTFGSRSSQQIHVRIHTGERPYGCRFCWKAFADGGTLRKHERIHTGEKPYACSVCPRAFNQRVVLRDHIRSHHSALDTKRNSYYCPVCSADLTTSNDLIQHLIEHSDKNTAMQRAPVSGPRKYKRRRKLKPHELAHLRNETKQNENENDGNSELDISDFDMDVDDILGITDTTNTTISSYDKANSKHHNSHFILADDISEEEIDVGDISPRKDGLGMDKNDNIWKDPPTLAATHKQAVEELPKTSVVNKSTKKRTKASKKDESTAQRTQQVQYTKAENSNTNGGVGISGAASTSSKQRKKTDKPKKTSGPRMIHTQKTLIPKTESSSKKRSKATVITKTTNSDISFLANRISSNIVDDYEIISPDIEPPRQISSSPLNSKVIKSEQRSSSRRGRNLYSQDLLASPSSQLPSSSRANDIFETQLLLESSSLRKNVFEKFNPDIVNDLEDILGSPIKGDKGDRQRFTSESSTTQFMTEQSEEDQHLIKIEPTSPDLRDIVSGGIGDTSQRLTRSRDNSKRKYLEFDHNGSLSSSLILSPTLSKHSNYENQNSTARTTPIEKTPTRGLSNKASSYSSLLLDTFSSSPVNVDSSYFSLSAVVSAAAASAAAAEAAANASQDRNRRVYECEMCSEVFTDRALLLDHVHIHI